MQLFHGDCLAVLQTFPDNSVDSLVTDPPAGISFMNRTWDGDKGGRDAWIAWLSAVMTEALRVLKPGGHALVWALPRTSHWTTTAMENAGFEIRDIIHHLFGTGMPKGLDVGKAIDKAAGAVRPVVGERERNPLSKRWREMEGREDYAASMQQLTVPATDAAKTWSGWNTALKPAAEHWILARKPIEQANIASNVLTYGTGALHIDACRVPPAQGEPTSDAPVEKTPNYKNQVYGKGFGGCDWSLPSQGRWPANVVLSHSSACRRTGTRQMRSAPARPERQAITDRNTYGTGRQSGLGGHGGADGVEMIEDWACAPECPVALLDAQSGQSTSTRSQRGRVKMFDKARYGLPESGWLGESTERGVDDTGGASRFFMRFVYVGKASPAERGTSNNHPTTKSLDLMTYLCLLVTPPGGTVLDCFMGSGSTGLACVREGFDFVGIEQDEGYFSIAVARLRAALGEQVTHGKTRAEG